MKRQLSFVLLCLLALAPLREANAQTKLTIGQASLSASGWPSFVADDLGFFRQEGVTQETVYVGNVASVAQQVVGRSLDIGYTTFEVAIQAIEAGAPIKLVGSTLIKYPYSLMALPEIKTAADLKGKSVILPLPHADVANFFDMWMTDNHLSAKDVDRVYDGSTPNRYAALQAHAVAAAAINSPLDITAAHNGFHKILDFGKYVQGYGFVGMVVREDWLAQHRDAAKAYLRAVSRGVDWLYDPANHDRAVEILMHATKQNKEISEATYDYYIRSLQPFSRGLNIPDPDLMNVVKTLKGLNIVKSQDTPKTKYVDLGLLPKSTAP